MRAHPRLLALLLSPARLIWLVALALALQPLAWARQPAAQWVSLPYCATGTAPAQPGALGVSGAVAGHARHLRVLLNPTAALNAAGAQVALPAAPGPALAFATPPARQSLREPAVPRHSAPRHRPQQARAPPQVV